MKNHYNLGQRKQQFSLLELRNLLHEIEQKNVLRFQ